MRIRVLLGLMILISTSIRQLSAQSNIETQGLGLDAGYTYNKGHMGYMGLSYSIYPGLDSYYSSGATLFQFSLGSYIGDFKNEPWLSAHKKTIPVHGTTFIPAASFSISRGAGIFLEGKVTATPYNVTPTLGLHVFNMVKLNAGYGIGYRRLNGVDMTGFSVSLGISIRLWGVHYVAGNA